MTAAVKLLENIRIILALNPACLFLGRYDGIICHNLHRFKELLSSARE